MIHRRSAIASLVVLCSGLSLHGAEPVTRSGPNPQEVKAMVDRAAAYLKTTQGMDGSFSPQRAGPGISAVVAAGLLRNGYSIDDPMVARTLAYLEKKVQQDGGIYDKFLANYTTSVALMAFAEANKDHRYDAVIKRATEFIRTMQYDKVESGDARFGGVGYDGKSRPDLSNTQYFLDALQAAGVGKDDPAVKRALLFVSRCQNLAGEHNDQPFAKKATENDKGGLVYNPLAQDNKREQTPQGGLRSVGAMTYAGLKSFLYAGLSKDDPRVQGAVRWIRAHYTLDENPGMGQAGLYYYYHTFAKAMTALGEDQLEDARKMNHDWRKELLEALKKRQRPDGSFLNKGDRAFGEGDPNLATAFALLTLSYLKTPAK
ncbi:MAG TPA: prenyltransferase/squalene oxidase repeat-containing protein [Gemmataceae bacterium]|jgi:squalene-hopene/tetraprenyl-beta-curcumene cyclase|nr:prenyltransferase/squalene oxidase repeat-containing protein [Gemmataceae bacterium]